MKKFKVMMPRVVIGFPSGGSVTVPFATSMMNLTGAQGMQPENERFVTRIIPAQGLYVSKNRNTIAKKFLTTGTEEWLLQIDTDIEFPPNIAEVMLLAALESGAKILAANVRLGAAMHSAYKRAEWLWQPMSELPEGRLFKVDAAATAVMLIHRDVLTAIKEKGGNCWFNHMYMEQGTEGHIEEIGEDLAFCERAAAVGFDIWMLRGVGLKHYKTRALVEHDEAAETISQAAFEQIAATVAELKGVA